MAKRKQKTLSHVDRKGAARMVDVSSKAITRRRAVATAELQVSPGTMALIQKGGLPKGDVFAIARLAGVQAAKETARLIPLCHPLPIDHVDVKITAHPPRRVSIRAEAAIAARTGVEMEALVAASITALTIYDMCKAVDRGIIIGPIQLKEKSGGRSGPWRRTPKGK
jgi:cyclic pyranopterin phosphate synthase